MIPPLPALSASGSYPESLKRIRSAIHTAARITATARVLDIGAGTGRIGRAFIEAGDFYIGVDTSLAMLQEFRGRFRSWISSPSRWMPTAVP